MVIVLGTKGLPAVVRLNIDGGEACLCSYQASSIYNMYDKSPVVDGHGNLCSHNVLKTSSVGKALYINILCGLWKEFEEEKKQPESLDHAGNINLK